LLAYLLVHRRAPQRREHLAGLFWPDSPEAQARTNLRRELHHLRRAFPEIGRFIELDTAAIQWRMDAPAAIDLAVFEEALAQAARARQAGPTMNIAARWRQQ
jgi:DNA-binding SARP family transcriptional activator